MSLAIMVMPVHMKGKTVEEIFLIREKIIVFLPSIIRKFSIWICLKIKLYLLIYFIIISKKIFFANIVVFNRQKLTQMS